MVWYRIRVKLGTSILMYYSELPVEVDDIIAVETRNGIAKGYVVEVDPISVNPFEPNSQGYKARRHVVENVTKNIRKEELIMFGCKTVEVKHVASGKTNIYYTDLTLAVNDTVVYEDESSMLHVGVVTDINPMVVTAKNFVVDKVDMDAHNKRTERIKEANKLKAQLDLKKKQFQDIELLRLIATSDPETKEMLDRYTKLIGGK